MKNRFGRIMDRRRAIRRERDRVVAEKVAVIEQLAFEFADGLRRLAGIEEPPDAAYRHSVETCDDDCPFCESHHR